jgi:hypothetical protein
MYILQYDVTGDLSEKERLFVLHTALLHTPDGELNSGEALHIVISLTYVSPLLCIKKLPRSGHRNVEREGGGVDNDSLKKRPDGSVNLVLPLSYLLKLRQQRIAVAATAIVDFLIDAQNDDESPGESLDVEGVCNGVDSSNIDAVREAREFVLESEEVSPLWTKRRIKRTFLASPVMSSEMLGRLMQSHRAVSEVDISSLRKILSKNAVFPACKTTAALVRDWVQAKESSGNLRMIDMWKSLLDGGDTAAHTVLDPALTLNIDNNFRGEFGQAVISFLSDRDASSSHSAERI